MSKEVSEIRQDPVSKDWVIIATRRARRPHDFKDKKEELIEDNIKDCPFEDPEKTGHKVLKTFAKDDTSSEWWIKVVENKYPVVDGDNCGMLAERGIYTVQPGAGHHEVIITRDHKRSIGRMTEAEAEKLVEAYQERFNILRESECANFVLVFHNHGREAGASVSHPHSQIIAIPILPADVRRSLDGSRNYHVDTSGGCIHCEMIKWERQEKRRIIYENENIVVIMPFVPRTAFEIRVYPKEHQPYFEKITPSQRVDFANALRTALGKLYTGLNNPAYNFFVHTAPSYGGQEHSYYHWHLEILPKTATMAGFELGTGVEISAVNPNDAAEYLRSMELPKSK